jgi:hypothetical protein
MSSIVPVQVSGAAAASSFKLGEPVSSTNPLPVKLTAPDGGLYTFARQPFNHQVAVLGDSIPYGNSFQLTGSGVYTRQYVQGYANWAAFLGRQRWTLDHEDNFGVAGNTTAEVLARTDAALAATTAGTVILDCLTNDEPNGISLAQSKLNYQAIIDKIILSGRIAVLITPRPRDITASGLTMTATQFRAHCARRDWVLGLNAPGQGIYVVDMWRYLADPSSTNGAMRTNYSYDGVHPGAIGGYWGGKALAELFGEGRGPGLFPFRDVLVAQNTDVWNASYTRGCVNSNPMLAGGTTAATGYTVGGGSGVTVTGSKVTSGDRSDVQQCVLSGTASAGADVYDFYQTITAGNLSVGDVVRAYADIEYDAAITGISSHGLTLIDTTGFNDGAGFLSDSTSVNNQAVALPNVAVSGVMRTPRLTLTHTTLRAGMKARTINGAAVALTYRMKAMSVRKAS